MLLFIIDHWWLVPLAALPVVGIVACCCGTCDAENPCSSDLPDEWQVDVSGFTNRGCTNCSTLDGTYILGNRTLISGGNTYDGCYLYYTMIDPPICTVCGVLQLNCVRLILCPCRTNTVTDFASEYGIDVDFLDFDQMPPGGGSDYLEDNPAGSHFRLRTTAQFNCCAIEDLAIPHRHDNAGCIVLPSPGSVWYCTGSGATLTITPFSGCPS